jgi:hypothetical protein
MSDTRRSADIPRIPDVEELAEGNPKVDVRQIREAYEMLKRLREEGVPGPRYGIASPHQGRKLRRQAGPRVPRT